MRSPCASSSLTTTSNMTTSPCEVINLYDVEDIDSWLENPDNVYIGRRTTTRGTTMTESKWQNTHHIIPGTTSREQACELYEIDVRENKELFDSIAELKGKTLGCYCTPLMCHGRVLQRLLGELISMDTCATLEPSTPASYSFILEDLSETLRNTSSDGFLEATADILADINGKRIFTPVKPKKRQGNAKLLSHEQFNFDIYKINQTGFTTNNPITWALAVEHYVKTDPEVKYKLSHKYDSNNLITHTHERKFGTQKQHTSQLP